MSRRWLFTTTSLNLLGSAAQIPAALLGVGLTGGLNGALSTPLAVKPLAGGVVLVTMGGVDVQRVSLSQDGVMTAADYAKLASLGIYPKSTGTTVGAANWDTTVALAASKMSLIEVVLFSRSATDPTKGSVKRFTACFMRGSSVAPVQLGSLDPGSSYSIALGISAVALTLLTDVSGNVIFRVTGVLAHTINHTLYVTIRLDA